MVAVLRSIAGEPDAVRAEIAGTAVFCGWPAALQEVISTFWRVGRVQSSARPVDAAIGDCWP